jgi:tRNA A22 N-methylase
MGGEEIVSILKRAENLPKTLVLQPMKNAEKVREILLFLGYGIVLDYTFYSGGKFYDLIKAVKGIKVKRLNKKQLKYGVDNLKLKPLAFIKKLQARISVLSSCLKDVALSKSARKEMKKELKELKKHVKS